MTPNARTDETFSQLKPLTGYSYNSQSYFLNLPENNNPPGHWRTIEVSAHLLNENLGRWGLRICFLVKRLIILILGQFWICLKNKCFFLRKAPCRAPGSGLICCVPDQVPLLVACPFRLLFLSKSYYLYLNSIHTSKLTSNDTFSGKLVCALPEKVIDFILPHSLYLFFICFSSNAGAS